MRALQKILQYMNSCGLACNLRPDPCATCIGMEIRSPTRFGGGQAALFGGGPFFGACWDLHSEMNRASSAVSLKFHLTFPE